MAPHEERVVAEKQELDEKIAKLHTFILSKLFTTLQQEDRDLLRNQWACMKQYTVILGKRLARFPTICTSGKVEQ